MQSVTVLTTHGRRQVVKVEPNKTVLWVSSTENPQFLLCHRLVYNFYNLLDSRTSMHQIRLRRKCLRSQASQQASGPLADVPLCWPSK